MYKVHVNDTTFSVVEKNGTVSLNGEPFLADWLEYRAGKFHILKDNRSYTAELVEMRPDDKIFVLKVNNTVYTVNVKDRYDELLKEMGIDGAASRKVNDIKAPMPGLVLRVVVESGQPVAKGDPILVLEAMKMENILKSPSDGVVRKVHVVKGDKVEKNQVMVNLV